MRIEGHYIAKPHIQAMGIAELCYNAGPKWKDVINLGTAVAIALAECNGGYTSYNDNFNDAGVLVQRDCGLFEIGIPGDQVGSEEEEKLRNDPAYNVSRAYALYDRREWQPWAAWLSAVCYDDGYRARGQLGVVNFLSKMIGFDAKEQTATLPADKQKARIEHHTLRTPFISIPELRKIYPNISLG